MRSSEELLFSDKLGSRAQIQDVMDDGLDGGYEDRFPELRQLLKTGSPYHRLMACMLLTAWGDPAGFEALIEWASHPDQAPWAGNPVTYDRIYGSDDAFANLADAVKTSFWNDETPQLRELQRRAAAALLGIYHAYFFDRTLALALLRDKTMPAQLEKEISAALERSLGVLKSGKKPVFDLGMQAASLILPLAYVNDEAAARYADEITRLSGSTRALRELAASLAAGTGEATRRSLEKLQQSGNPEVIEEAKKALAARAAK